MNKATSGGPNRSGSIRAANPIAKSTRPKAMVAAMIPNDGWGALCSGHQAMVAKTTATPIRAVAARAGTTEMAARSRSPASAPRRNCGPMGLREPDVPEDIANPFTEPGTLELSLTRSVR